jgi:Mg/Co/Ni transporter MgtE
MDRKKLLPYVNEEIGFALQKEFLETQGNEYVTQVLTRLREDNPCIANFISNMSVSSGDPTSCATTGILVYRLLESQAEADKLKSELEGKLG